LKCDDCGFLLADVDEEDLPEGDDVSADGSAGGGGDGESSFVSDFHTGVKLLVIHVLGGMMVWVLFKVMAGVFGVSTRYGRPRGVLVLLVAVIFPFSIWIEGVLARLIYGWE
jgi:hypothetical protein